MNIKAPIPDKDYRVLVRCATYNQSKYICDALNGFAIQETDFPFICIVVDDASKDGNQEVIRQYANDNCDMSNAYVYDDDISVYMRVSHKTNTNCVYLFCFLKVNLYCKQEKQEIYKPYRAVCEFEAICEGDDYWIDPLKLQKQVDILDSNFNYSFCHTGFSFYYQEKNKFESCPPVPSFSNAIEKMIAILDYNRYRVQTNTVLMRREALNRVYTNNDDCFDKRFFMGDTQLWVLLLEQGDCYYLEDNTAVYRINEESTCRSRDYKKQLRFWISSEEMRLYLFNRLNYHCGVYDKVYDSYLKKCYEYKHLDSSFQPMFDLKISNYFDYFRFVLKYQYRKLKHKIFS